jgi:hypothetical protein
MTFFLKEREKKRKKRRKGVMMTLEKIGRNIWKKNSVIPLPCAHSSPFWSCLDKLVA